MADLTEVKLHPWLPEHQAHTLSSRKFTKSLKFIGTTSTPSGDFLSSISRNSCISGSCIMATHYTLPYSTKAKSLVVFPHHSGRRKRLSRLYPTRSVEVTTTAISRVILHSQPSWLTLWGKFSIRGLCSVADLVNSTYSIGGMGLTQL